MRMQVVTSSIRRAGLAGLVCVGAFAAPGAARAQQAPPGCTAPEHEQFDFWLGEWEVTNLAGEVVGTNTITSGVAGCAIHERWQGARGGTGVSLNAYDPRTESWHQTWVGSGGLVLRLEGGLDDGSMVLEGELPEGDGTVRHRITWTPQGDGTVRQVWDTSTDGGRAWETGFDGTYRRIGAG